MLLRVVDQRGLAKRIKRRIPAGAFRALTQVYNASMSTVPYSVKYAIGGRLRQGKLPYSALASTDEVIQIGCPRDLLAAGRSRAIYFARLVPNGAVLVVEPDPENCRALRELVQAQGLTNVRVAELGAWKAKTVLTFLSNADHPAANVLADLHPASDGTPDRIESIAVEVDTVDAIATAHGITMPRLISITTNGAELPILEGLGTLLGAGYPEYLSLARTGVGYVDALAEIGYDYVGRDDRGYCFRRRSSATARPAAGG